jgi:hypothetical protein
VFEEKAGQILLSELTGQAARLRSLSESEWWWEPLRRRTPQHGRHFSRSCGSWLLLRTPWRGISVTLITGDNSRPLTPVPKTTVSETFTKRRVYGRLRLARAVSKPVSQTPSPQGAEPTAFDTAPNRVSCVLHAPVYTSYSTQDAPPSGPVQSLIPGPFTPTLGRVAGRTDFPESGKVLDWGEDVPGVFVAHRYWTGA